MDERTPEEDRPGGRDRGPARDGRRPAGSAGGARRSSDRDSGGRGRDDRPRRDAAGGRPGQGRPRRDGEFRRDTGARRSPDGRGPRRDGDRPQGGYQQRSSRPPQASQERQARRDEPALPESITGAELDKHVRGQLGTLSPENALTVAKHLIAAGMCLDEDPELAYAHAMAAENRAGRIAVVREAAGFAAYHTGRYEQALREFRTVRRLTGSHEYLPLIADCERGRGKPERAVELLDAPEVKELDRAGQLELLMVASGARRDLGQPGAAALLLQVPELTGAVKPSLVDARARLLLAYAEALADDGRTQEAETWRRRAYANDPNGVLDDPAAADDDEDAFFTDLEDGDE